MGRKNKGINVVELYNLLIMFMPKPAAITFIVLLFVLPVAIPLVQYNSLKADMHKQFFAEMMEINEQSKDIQKKLDFASMAIYKKIPQNYNYNSYGLVKYFYDAFPGSLCRGNILETNFAQLKFFGDGQCFQKEVCTVSVVPNNFKDTMDINKDTILIYLKRENPNSALKSTGMSISSNRNQDFERHPN